MNNPKDFPISQLRIVEVTIHQDFVPNKQPHRYMMHADQVDTFIAATSRLHYTHGNPHTATFAPRPPENLWEIRVDQLSVETVSYWWCTRDLMKNGDPNGARLNHTGAHATPSRRVWANPKLIEQEKEARRQAERDEYDAAFEE